jgi:hypothetical protein
MVRRFLESSALYFVALGGNRSSKSWSGSVCGVMTAMGATHPDVVELLRRNGLQPGRLPQAPGLVLAGSITNDDSRDYLRPIYDSLLPDTWEWSARFAAQTASTWQPGSGAGLPGSVLFKTTSGSKRQAALTLRSDGKERLRRSCTTTKTTGTWKCCESKRAP